MSLFDAMRRGIETKASDMSGLTWERLLGTPASKAGVPVNWNTALCHSTVLACGRVLAEGVAQLPAGLYDKRADRVGADEIFDGRLANVLTESPNDFQTPFEFFEAATFNAVVTGSGRALIERVGGEVAALIPLVPGKARKVVSPSYDVTYEVQGVGTVPASMVFEIHGPSWDGICGLDMVQLGHEALGLSLAAEEAQSRLFANGVQAGGLVSISGTLQDASRERLKAQWKEFHEGLQNRFKTIFLDQDAKFTPFAQTGVDAQHLETRRYQLEEICRGLRVFPQMIGHSDKTSTFASAEAFFTANVMYSQMPWLVRWQQAVRRQLIDRNKTPRRYFKFMVQGLLRGDAKARGAFYQSGIQNGWLTRNEVRSFEELNPIDGLDEPLRPLNMVGIDEEDPEAAAAGGGQKRRVPFDGSAAERRAFQRALEILAYSPSQPRGPDGRFASIVARIAAIVERAGHRGATRVSIPLGRVRSWRRIRKVTGLNLRGYRHSLGSWEARHILRQHGNAERERRRGQEPIGEADFKHLPRIVATSEILGAHNSREGRKRIMFERTIGAHRYTAIAEVHDATRELAVVTMWKKKI